LQPREDDRNQQAKENALIEDFGGAAGETPLVVSPATIEWSALSRKHTIAQGGNILNDAGDQA